MLRVLLTQEVCTTLQIRYFEVTEDELVEQRKLFRDGQLALKIETDTFDMAKYNAFVVSVAEETAAFKAKQQEAAVAQVTLVIESLETGPDRKQRRQEQTTRPEPSDSRPSRPRDSITEWASCLARASRLVCSTKGPHLANM